MRRVTGFILAGLGVLLILAAILLPGWVNSQFIKFPLSENQTAVLQASNASYFSAAVFKEQAGVTIQATYTINGEPGKIKYSDSTGIPRSRRCSPAALQGSCFG